jgi:hypothetical protein
MKRKARGYKDGQVVFGYLGEIVCDTDTIELCLDEQEIYEGGITEIGIY